ncbi:hypothetical protein B6D12_06640 [Gilliamella apicola]|nr:DUF3850 domain-containing protein [Gilliamella apicola]OTP90218.1 hypothetical protein B5S41_04230 [Gilliamella apicola]OTP96262.1 hypothetical protein B6D13_01920 [Gilliamella apicola]OTQ02549.1 hypothetical protein B6D07_05305 [Gilliamella apicola]OTQ05657.1 hypothetical protein B6D12_06640 [Gilliamella apicola]OTQ23084.1 hypothetical protein B6D02_13210 [Gilliamella apicola]
MATHSLKIKSEHYINIINGTKTAEIRYNDRNYQVGDILILNEIDENGVFTGNKCSVIVTHVLDDNQYLQTGYVMLSVHMLNSDDSHKNINEIKAQGIKEAVINQVLQHRLMTEREFTWQSYRDEILSYADRLKND